MAHRLVAHAASRGVVHFRVLDVEPGVRQLVQVAGMVVVQVGENDVGDIARLHAQGRQGFDGAAQQVALPYPGGFRVEALYVFLKVLDEFMGASCGSPPRKLSRLSRGMHA